MTRAEESGAMWLVVAQLLSSHFPEPMWITNRKYVAQRPLPSSCGLKFNGGGATAFFLQKRREFSCVRVSSLRGEWYSKLDWTFS